MSKKFYKLHCEVCNWTKVTDGSDIEELYQLKTAPVPIGVPRYDNEQKKIISKEPQKQTKKFRCPNCGRVVAPKQIKNPQEKIDQYMQELAAQKLKDEWDELETETQQRYLDARAQYDEEQSELDRD